MRMTFERADPRTLQAAHRAAINDLLVQRVVAVPGRQETRLPRSIDEISFPDDSLVLLAWRSPAEVSAMLVGYWNPDNDPALAIFEGKAPFAVPFAYFGPLPSLADTPDPLGVIRESFPRLDRVTVHVPVGDSMTATALGWLGFTLDSYLDIGFAGDARASRPVTSHPYRLRPATPDDAEAIAGLHALHVRCQIGTSAFVADSADPDFEALPGELRSRIADGAIFRVAIIDGELAGVVEAASYDIPADGKVRRVPSGRAGVIEWVATAPRYRRRGIGSALVAAALEELRVRRADYAYVCRGANNRLSSPGFWRKFGFHPAWGTWEMAIVETRSGRITPGSAADGRRIAAAGR